MSLTQLWRAWRFWAHLQKEAKMKGWRTLGFNLLTGVAYALSSVTAIPGLDAQTLFGINLIGNLVLRFFTNTPVGKKE